MHCTSQSLIRGTFSSALRPAVTAPPIFLAPLQAFTPFSTTAVLAKKRKPHRDANPARGTSALRHTGLKKQTLGSKPSDLPKPVLDPARRSTIEVNPSHGLWAFFNDDGEAMEPPTTIVAHGRAWTAAELRKKEWADLHGLWWVCLKEINRMNTMEAERKRLNAGYGEYEFEQRVKTVRTTMQRIKHVLTERWYAWEDARWDAMADPSIDMYVEQGESAYDVSKDVTMEDAFEDTAPAAETDTPTGNTQYLPPGAMPSGGGQEARV